MSNSATLEKSTSKPVRMTAVQPYLFFSGRADDAIAFYRRALGAEVLMLMRFKDVPPPPAGEAGCGGPPMPANWGDKVMHATLRIGTTDLLLSDGCFDTHPGFQAFSLSLNVSDEAEAERFFAALADGGQIEMPLGPTFFAARFGSVKDKFGVDWMIYLAP